MAYVLANDSRYSLLAFDSEKEFEKCVIANKNHLFGDEAIYIDVKKRVGRNDSFHKGIPDAFLIDFFEKTTPQLYFIENELISHDVYTHILDQLARFNGSIISAQPQLRNMLLEHINKNPDLRAAIEEEIKGSPLRNLEELMLFLTEKQDVKIALVIDDESSDLNIALKVFRNPPDVVVLRRYMCKDKTIYMYEPLRQEVEENQAISSKAGRVFDTVICPAFAKGFKHAYVENDAWWAIRLSQEAREHLKYLAIYEKSPVAAVRHYAEITRIEPYKDTGKFIVYLKNKKTISAVKLGKDGRRGVAPQGPRFTTVEKLKQAKKLSDLWR